MTIKMGDTAKDTPSRRCADESPRVETVRTLRRHGDADQLDALAAIERLFLLLLLARDGVLRCGDVVRHAPTGEEWVLAYADYQRGEVSWSGWPDGVASLVDVALISRCSDEQHHREVSRWLANPHHGLRGAAIRRLYRPESTP